MATTVAGADPPLMTPSAFLYRSYPHFVLLIRAVDKKYKRKETKQRQYRQEYTGKQFSFQKINRIATASPYQIACAAQFPKLSSLAAAASP